MATDMGISYGVNWDGLPRLVGEYGTLDDAQEVVFTILLQNAWRQRAADANHPPPDDSIWQTSTRRARLRSLGRAPTPAMLSRLNMDSVTSHCMIIMVLFILGMPPPSLDDDENSIPLPTSYYKEHQISIVQDAVDHLFESCETYKDVSALLSKVAIAGVSPALVCNACNVYRVFFAASLSDTRPLWVVLHNMNSHDLQKNTLQPVTRDLWNFLLECSQRNTGHKANILLTHDSIKLLLVLTRQCISVALRVLPDDWIWLAQVLQDAEQSGLILSDTADPQETIPALARQALDALVPIIADAAPQLRMALAQLAALRVPPTTEPTTTTWWHGPVQMVRRFGSRVANVMSRRLPDAGCHPAAMEEGASYDVFPTRVPALPTASAGALPSADQASRTPTPIHAIPDSGSITNILRSNDYPTSAESSTDKGTANRGDSSSPSFLPDTTPPLAT